MISPSKSTDIQSILAGVVSEIPGSSIRSGIGNQPVSHSVDVSTLGLQGDEHADNKNHGGTEMAVHHYPYEHYKSWCDEYPQLCAHLTRPGAFGENISTIGMTENWVAIGDVFRVGEAVLQVSQGRQPCWKLDIRFGMEGMATALQKTGRTGWYYRVLQPGKISVNDKFVLDDRAQKKWTISRLIKILYEEKLNRDELIEMSNLQALCPSWRQLAQRRLDSGEVENWSSRLFGSQK